MSDPSEPGAGPAPPDDVRVALVVLAVSAGVFALTFGFDRMPPALMQGLGPELFPRLVLAAIAALALALGWRGRHRRAAPAPIARPVWTTAAALVAATAAIELVGLLAAGAAAVVGIGALWGERRWTTLLLTAAGLIGGIWLVFARALGVVLPPGLVGRWLSG